MVDPALILAVAGTSSLGAVVTAARTLIRERFSPKKNQVVATLPHGEIVTVTITDSDGNTFKVSPTENEGKLMEKLVERHSDDAG